jgi:hypothetical protein
MDYAPIQAFLVGRCGKSIVQAAKTSYEEYELLIEAHRAKDREKWERLRWRIYMDWRISPNLKERPKKPQDIMLFPWEKETAEAHDIEPLTESEVLGLCEIFKIKREDVNNG